MLSTGNECHGGKEHGRWSDFKYVHVSFDTPPSGRSSLISFSLRVDWT